MRERLKEIRKALHITQQQLAEALHVSKSAVESYEYGRADMTDRVILDICRLYNINETWIRSGDGDMFEPLDRESEIAQITARLYKEAPEGLYYKIVKNLYDMDESQLEIWVKSARELLRTLDNMIEE